MSWLRAYLQQSACAWSIHKNLLELTMWGSPQMFGSNHSGTVWETWYLQSCICLTNDHSFWKCSLKVANRECSENNYYTVCLPNQIVEYFDSSCLYCLDLRLDIIQWMLHWGLIHCMLTQCLSGHRKWIPVPQNADELHHFVLSPYCMGQTNIQECHPETTMMQVCIFSKECPLEPASAPSLLEFYVRLPN